MFIFLKLETIYECIHNVLISQVIYNCDPIYLIYLMFFLSLKIVQYLINNLYKKLQQKKFQWFISQLIQFLKYTYLYIYILIYYQFPCMINQVYILILCNTNFKEVNNCFNVYQLTLNRYLFNSISIQHFKFLFLSTCN